MGGNLTIRLYIVVLDECTKGGKVSYTVRLRSLVHFYVARQHFSSFSTFAHQKFSILYVSEVLSIFYVARQHFSSFSTNDYAMYTNKEKMSLLFRYKSFTSLGLNRIYSNINCSYDTHMYRFIKKIYKM